MPRDVSQDGGRENMMTQGATARYVDVGTAAGLAIVGTLCSIYIVSQFLRNSVGVIAPELAAEIHLSPAEIGLLSSAFFFSFAAAQMPLGLAIDRYGPKRCVVACAVLVIGGCVFFAYGTTASQLILGRVLLGLGSASFFMAPLAIYARWFAPERFSTLTGVHLGVGSVGTLCATAPLAMIAAAWGWRTAFLGIGVIALLIMATVIVLVRDDPPGRRAERHYETLGQSIAGLISAIRTPSVGRLFLLNLASYSSFVLIVGLWGAPYLTHHYGYDLKSRGELLFVPALTQIFGAFFWGPMDRVFGYHKAPVLLGCGITAAALAVLAVAGRPPLWSVVVLFVVIGFFSAMTPVQIAHGQSLFPTRLIGRGITLFNMAAMAGVFLSQTVTGVVIELFPTDSGIYPLNAYRSVFALQAAFLIVACIVYAGSHDPGRHRSG